MSKFGAESESEEIALDARQSSVSEDTDRSHAILMQKTDTGLSSVGGKMRLQMIAQRVININRLTVSSEKFWEPGAEAGVDVNSMDFNDIDAKCRIFCADFSKSKYAIDENLTNSTIKSFLKKKRPDWSKVRWINVDGVSWDRIVSTNRNASNPLQSAVERGKAWSPNMCANDMGPLPFSICSQDGENVSEDLVSAPGHDSKSASPTNSRKNLLEHGHREGSKYLEAHKLLRKEKLNVIVEHVSIFMVSGGTLITVFQHGGTSVYTPIRNRLQRTGTLLRTSEDVSLLMEAIIDAIVDLALPITDSYRHQIADLEGKILIRPKMQYTRELHIITGELTLLRRTLGPIQGLVNNMNLHHDENHFISEMAKTYFTDVLDHCNTIVDDLDTMTTISENLINMTFNAISYETNEYMRAVALMTVIFSPMTFVAGFFGMNFTNFPELDNGLNYFWKWTASFTLAITLMFNYRPLVQLVLRGGRFIARNWNQKVRKSI
ncbi:8089_t:CDS:10 [Paraglomus occultum]|uniref:8089_t:CDS:1 n=1 Tax=Paraglomus occultum TaxID=144539 RepID=A0A9N9AXM1_9GLOM|nr:8089_t:CDS:10 [Paraglomus occultum]